MSLFDSTEAQFDRERIWQILELYSGIGGMHYAVEGNNQFHNQIPQITFYDLHFRHDIALLLYSESGIKTKVVFSTDVNNSANDVYRHNFPSTNQQSRNIVSLTAKEINHLQPDVIMMSPPCQPFTRTGLKMDVNDPRCSSFLHLLDVIPNLNSVQYILMENVVGFETSAMRNAFVEVLKTCKFFFREFIITPEKLGIPNSRNRYYLIARKKRDFNFGSDVEIVSKIELIII